LRFLLIISCSGRKDKTEGRISAIDRYDGVYYKVIKKLRREDKLPENLDIVIISAKYGFLKPDDLIENYDMRMDEERAKRLNSCIVEI